MAWGFRRSRKVGPFRFTLSKSGLSTSVGGKGLRVSSGPRGVYVTSSAGGFYYRQRLGGGEPPRQPAQAAPRYTREVQGAVEHIVSAPVDALTDLTQKDFVTSLNEWTTRGHVQIVYTLAALAAVVAAAVRGGACVMLSGPA